MTSYQVSPKRAQSGFTLIELMITVSIVAILMSIAVPSYRSYIVKQRISTGQADLVALALNLDGHLMNNTVYPAPVNGVTALRAALPGWVPVQAGDFTYALVSVDNNAFPPAYAITATGASAMTAGCVISLNSSGARTKTGCAGGAASW